MIDCHNESKSVFLHFVDIVRNFRLMRKNYSIASVGSGASGSVGFGSIVGGVGCVTVGGRIGPMVGGVLTGGSAPGGGTEVMVGG